MKDRRKRMEGRRKENEGGSRRMEGRRKRMEGTEEDEGEKEGGWRGGGRRMKGG